MKIPRIREKEQKMLGEGKRSFHCSKVGDDLWAYGLIRVDRPIPHFGEFGSLVELWHRFGAGRGPECVRFRDPFVLRNWIGRIAIDEVILDPFDLHCVLFGVTASEIYDEVQLPYLCSFQGGLQKLESISQCNTY